MIARERWHRDQWEPPWLRHQHQERYHWAARACAGLRVLDVACGVGYGSRILFEEGKARSVDGFDLSAEAIAEAEQSPLEGVRFAIGDATRLPVDDGAYDMVVSLETIEHVDDDGAYLRELSRVLRPGGVFICSTPNRRVLNPGTALSDRPFNPFHLREYAQEDFFPRVRAYFDDVETFGQRLFDRRYVEGLARVGRRAPPVAVKLHQLRKVAGMPWERPALHTPRPITPDVYPEVLIARAKRRADPTPAA